MLFSVFLRRNSELLFKGSVKCRICIKSAKWSHLIKRHKIISYTVLWFCKSAWFDPFMKGNAADPLYSVCDASRWYKCVLCNGFYCYFFEQMRIDILYYFCKVIVFIYISVCIAAFKDIIYFTTTDGDSTAEVALVWSTAYDSKIFSFAKPYEKELIYMTLSL